MRNGECLRIGFLPLLLLVFFMCAPVLVMAADEEGGIKTSSEIQLQISTLPEVKFCFNQNFIFPFLQGSGPLIKDNNVTVALRAELSPVSLNGIGEIIWTPVAFFLISGGGMAGTGWNYALGDGIGLCEPVGGGSPRKTETNGKAFGGLNWRAWGAATLQFDLGAVIPGDWTHVLFQTRQEFRYAGYTGAGSGDFWVFENDDRENQNGWVYYASYVLGYQMPQSPVLNTIAFMAEMAKSLYNTSGGDSWGEGLGRWFFSGIFNFSFHPKFSTAVIVQMRTLRNFGTSNLNDNSYYYPDLVLEKEGGRRRVLFHRAAFILSYKIH